MSDDHEYSVQAAREAAERDELDAWVARFLASPGSDNAPLADKLSEPRRWWLGPVQLPVDQLQRLAGSHQDGKLVLEDGNHRVEGVRRAGKDYVWAVIAFEDPGERNRFVAPSPA